MNTMLTDEQIDDRLQEVEKSGYVSNGELHIYEAGCKWAIAKSSKELAALRAELESHKKGIADIFADNQKCGVEILKLRAENARLFDALKNIAGIEFWIDDDEVKEKFTAIVYPAIKAAENPA